MMLLPPSSTRTDTLLPYTSSSDLGDDQFGLQRDGVFEDALDAGFGQRVDAVDRQAKPRGAAGHLRQGFLAGDIESRQRRRHLRDRMQQKSGLADAGVAADQQHRALDQANDEYSGDLADDGSQEASRVGNQSGR